MTTYLPRGGDGRVRRAAAAAQAASGGDALVAEVAAVRTLAETTQAGLTDVAVTVTANTAAIASLTTKTDETVIRTRFTLDAATVAALPGTLGAVELGTLAAGHSIVQMLAKVVTPFVSTTPGYTLNGEVFWRAETVVSPDTAPLDVTAKSAFVIGSDLVDVPVYASIPSAGDSPVLAVGNPHRWGYETKLMITLSSLVDLATYSAGSLEITVASVSML